MVDWLDPKLRRLRIAVRLLAAGLIIAITGCAPPSDLDAKTGRELQGRVLAVSTAAAKGDPATGLRTLDELVEHLTRAAANGDVSFKRHQSIMKAVETVRAGLRAAAAAETAATKAAAEKAAAAKAAAATAAAEAPATQDIATNQVAATLAPQPAQTPQPAKETPARGADKGKGKKDG